MKIAYIKKHRIAKYIQGINFREIKKKNLDFSITYSVAGCSETYTEVLSWWEIEKPKDISIEIQHVIILENGTEIKNLVKVEAEKLVLLLDRHNSNIKKYGLK